MTLTIDIEKTTTAKSLNYDFVPGTVHLVDVIGNLSVKKDDGGEDIILQPQPTSNINDPLRWSKGKKRFQFFLLWLWYVSIHSFLQLINTNFLFLGVFF